MTNELDRLNLFLMEITHDHDNLIEQYQLLANYTSKLLNDFAELQHQFRVTKDAYDTLLNEKFSKEPSPQVDKHSHPIEG